LLQVLRFVFHAPVADPKSAGTGSHEPEEALGGRPVKRLAAIELTPVHEETPRTAVVVLDFDFGALGADLERLHDVDEAHVGEIARHTAFGAPIRYDLALRPAYRAPDFGHDRLDHERLGQEIFGAHLERFGLSESVGARRRDEDRRVGLACFHGQQKIEAIDSGQAAVENRRDEHVLVDHSLGRPTVARDVDVDLFIGETSYEVVERGGLTVCDQYRRGRGCRVRWIVPPLDQRLDGRHRRDAQLQSARTEDDPGFEEGRLRRRVMTQDPKAPILDVLERKKAGTLGSVSRKPCGESREHGLLQSGFGGHERVSVLVRESARDVFFAGNSETDQNPPDPISSCSLLGQPEGQVVGGQDAAFAQELAEELAFAIGGDRRTHAARFLAGSLQAATEMAPHVNRHVSGGGAVREMVRSPTQVAEKRPHGLKAARSVALQCGEANGIDRLWNVQVELRRRRYGLLDDQIDRLLRVLTAKEPPSREHFPQHDACAEDVGALIDFVAAHLFGRHVAELAVQVTRQLKVRLLRDEPSDAEIGHFHFAFVGDQDVLRRNVSVNDAERATPFVGLSMCVIESRQEFRGDARRDRYRDALFAPVGRAQDGSQIAAIHVLHGQVDLPLDVAEVEDLHDVEVLEIGRELRLLNEHPHEGLVAAVPRQDALEGDDLFEARVAVPLREEDLGHSPVADALEQDVVAKTGRGWLAHRGRPPICTPPEAPLQARGEGRRLAFVLVSATTLSQNERVPRLHLVDGSSYIFRAYWAIRSLTNSAGEPTNAIYGVAQMFEKMLREEQPEYLGVVFDADGPTFRNEIHPDYKAHRPPPPEDLVEQIQAIHEVIDAFRIRRFVVPGVEADDVIATLARRGKREGFEVVLISGDKDLMQLVDDDLSMFEPMRGERYDAAKVEEKLGVPPSQVRDLLALAGDSTDNVPGVPGVGLKTAAKFLAAHRDVAGVIRAASEGVIKGKTGQRILEAEDDAKLSQQLVALDDQVELPIESVNDLRWSGPDLGALEAIYRRNEFTRLLARFEKSEEADAGDDGRVLARLNLREPSVRRLSSADELEAWLTQLRAPGPLCVRIESPSARALDARIDGLALAAPGLETVYVSVPWPEVIARLGPRLATPEIEVASDESKLLCGLSAEAGYPVRGLAFDAKLAGYLLEPDESDQGYEALARRYFGCEPTARDQTLRAGRKRIGFDEADPEVAARLATEAAIVIRTSAEHLPEEMARGGVESVLHDVELPLVPVLARMERAGVRIDVDRLKSLSSTFDEELKRLEARCHEIAGHEFNVASPKQLERVLFEELELKIKRRTSTGRPSTDHSVLEELSADHPLPQAVVDYRQVQKLKGTYVDALPKLVSPRTGRVHTIFNQAMAATGRLSSMEPNLQNIPIRTEIGRQLRTVFVAEEGNALVSVDYSQIELRVLAHLSGDEVLQKAFEDRADVHVRTAAALFGVPPGEVTREQRSQAKAVNYGVAYGMGPVRLARDMKVPRKLASKFIADYFERQPGVHAYVEETLARARETGEVRTILGRRRRVPDVNSSSRGVRSAAERAARATPVQGSAADLIKLAMLRVDAMLEDRFADARILLQVHDELLIEAPVSNASAVAEAVKTEMESVYPLSVPLEADAHTGRSWDDAH